jgi:hypothetical protein
VAASHFSPTLPPTGERTLVAERRLVPKFVYHGPPAQIVALNNLVVTDGWTGEGPAALDSAAGFTRAGKSDSKKDGDD